MFNFLQAAALAAGFPLHWPKELETLFDFQGAISTAGEHILSPDCSVQGVSAASLFYAKQIAFAMIPPLLFLFVYLIWKSYSTVSGVPWRERATKATHTPKDKMVVTICVLLYFFWPTLLNQTFRLFSCRQIGGNEIYLMADFEEPCFVGRHLLFVFIVGITQILLYAIGLPMLMFVFLHRHQHELKKPVVKFRYGLFFSGFRKETYYWEVVVALRKQSTVVLAVFGPNMGTNMLAHVALLVLLIQILVQLIGHPYTVNQQILQILDLASMIICWLTMWSGFFFLGAKKEWDKSLLILLTLTILLINVLHMLILVGCMCFEMCKEQEDTSLMNRLRTTVKQRISVISRYSSDKVTREKSKMNLMSEKEFNSINESKYSGEVKTNDKVKAKKTVGKMEKIFKRGKDLKRGSTIGGKDNIAHIEMTDYVNPMSNKHVQKEIKKKERRERMKKIRKSLAVVANRKKKAKNEEEEEELNTTNDIFLDMPDGNGEIKVEHDSDTLDNTEEKCSKTAATMAFRKVYDTEVGIFYENVETGETEWDVPDNGVLLSGIFEQ